MGLFGNKKENKEGKNRTEKIGILDVGGGMRDIYGAGIFDYLIEKEIEIPYCIGVSAGSANIASYISKQKGRNFRFYEDYSFDKQYMSFKNYLKNGSYLDLDYIYGTLSNTDGKDAWNFEKAMKSKQEMVVVSSDANTGKPVYFSKKDYKKDDYGMLKSSSNVPIVNKAYKWRGYELYDGGVCDPIPYKKAFEDGCDKLIVILTRPIDFKKKTKNARHFEKLRKQYPNFVEKLYSRCDLYNVQLEDFKNNYVAKGKGFIVGPENTFGIDTLTKNKEAMQKLYDEGYKDGKKIEDYWKENVEK